MRQLETRRGAIVEDSGTTAKRTTRRRSRRVGLVVLVLGAVLVVRLAVAPLSLPFGGWLAERIAARTEAAVEIGAVAVQIGPGRLHLVLRDVGARGERFGASAGAVRLVQGFTGRTVVIEEPRVRLDPSAGNALTLPMPDAALTALNAVADRLWRTARDRGLDRLSITGGRLEILAPRRPISEARVLRDIEASLAVGEAGMLTADLQMLGAGGLVTLSARREVAADGPRLTVSGYGIDPRDLAPAKMVQRGLGLEPRFEARWSDRGVPESASLSVAIGAGDVRFAKDPPRTLDSGAMALEWKAGKPEIALSEATFRAGGTNVALEGTITPRPDGAPWEFQIATREALFAAPDIAARPVDVKLIEASGRIDFAERLLQVDRLVGWMPRGRVDAAFSFDASRDGPLLSGAVEIGPGTIPALLGAWPPVMAHGPRVALLSTVLGGVLERASVDFALTPLELDGDPATNDMIEGGLSLDATFLDATFAVPELPVALKRAAGTLKLRDKALVAEIDGGTIEAGAGGDLTVREGRFAIRELGRNPVIARASLTVEGPLTAVVSLAERFGITEVSGTALSVDDVEGRVRATVSITTPLGPDVPPSERAWGIEARLFGAGSRVPIGGQTFEDANIEVGINSRRLAARGRAVIDGLTVDVNYSELFAGKRRTAARVVLTDKDRRERGFDTGDLVRGPVVMTIESGDSEDRTITADLTEAEVAVPGYAKEPGAPLTAEAVLTVDGPRTSVRDVRLDGGKVQLAGRMVLEDGSLAEAEFDTVRLSPGDTARLSIDRRNGLYRVSAQAGAFDARPFIESLMSAGGGAPADGPPVAVEATGDRVRVGSDTVITDLSLSATRAQGKVQRLAASGRLDGVNSGSFGITLTPEGSARRLKADVASLGRVLSAFDIYRRLRDGRTSVEGTLGADGVLRGRFVARDFQVANERTLEEIIAKAQTRQAPSSRLERAVSPMALRAGSEVDAGGIPFDELTVDFEQRGKTIVVREAILRGTVMGGTAEGLIDLDAGLVRLTGTFIPAYGVNNLFGRLPIFGQILGAGETGGLIGVTFRLAGPIDDPRLTVNPISAIAPGIFRRIFEFR